MVQSVHVTTTPHTDARSLIALTHAPSPRLDGCELTFLPVQRIDQRRAEAQHTAYCTLLRECGARVVQVQGNEAFPDGVFVEDTAVVLDEVAVVTPMGTASRRPETTAIEHALKAFRPVHRLAGPGKLEGGDVLRVDRTLFVGQGSRTDTAGLKALEAVVAPFGYTIVPVAVTGCLHLKTGVTAVDDGTVLINPDWVDAACFRDFQCIHVPTAEPFAANVLRVGQAICMHAGFTETRERLDARGYRVMSTDISEFLKAEAGLTCMSILLAHAE
ncbi:MAG: arginine deiminase family protein [Rhodothermales bacterium]